jgi:hypothetical protein
MDIDNYDQFDLYEFVCEYYINDGNVLVYENNLNQVLYQHKDDQVFLLYVNDIDKSWIMMNIHIIENVNIFDDILNQLFVQIQFED